METTPHLELPYIIAGQAQKHITVNTALQKLDALTQISVKSRALTTPPSEPTSGDRYLVATGGTGDWDTADGNLCLFDGGIWNIFVPVSGWTLWVEDENITLVFDGATWAQPPVPEQMPRLGIGAPSTPDTHFLVETNNTLFTGIKQAHGGTGDMRHVINKEASSDCACLIFQNDYSGYAELGLIGNEDLAVRVSGDGTNFTTAMTFDNSNAHVGIGATSSAYRFCVEQDTPVSGGFSVSNYNTDSNASSNMLLNAANDHYFKFQLYGSGTLYAYTNAAMVMGTYASEPMYFKTDTTDRMTIHADGRVSIGTHVASAQLSVDGAVRTGGYTQSTLPSASSEGAGAQIFVTDIGTNGEPAFSDGTDWRSTVTGNIV